MSTGTALERGPDTSCGAGAAENRPTPTGRAMSRCGAVMPNDGVAAGDGVAPGDPDETTPATEAPGDPDETIPATEAPGEGEAKPGEGEAKPGEGEAKPGEVEAAPGEAEAPPAGVGAEPAPLRPRAAHAPTPATASAARAATMTSHLLTPHLPSRASQRQSSPAPR
ncbi:MAG TPA: hypothetical protein VEL75_15340 [Candidatus Methylomirabilis sp.]|nr:hypothetical protein [Candidatus Methylomirabilis sp.]